MPKITVLNGPNLNLLGTREPEIYGIATLADIENICREHLKSHNITLNFLQSNHEGFLIDAIHQAIQESHALAINPGAFGHSSLAIYDALLAFPYPKVEIHISNVWKREEFRHFSTISPAMDGVISGLGAYGYVLALDYLQKNIQTNAY